jgi:hypothetical protein
MFVPRRLLVTQLRLHAVECFSDRLLTGIDLAFCEHPCRRYVIDKQPMSAASAGEPGCAPVLAHLLGPVMAAMP